MQISDVKKYIVKNVYSGLLKTIVSLSLSIIVLPLIIQKIGLEQYGIISVSLLFFNFSGVLDLGLSKSLVYYQKDSNDNHQQISAIYLLNLAIVGFLIICSILVYLLNINFIGDKLNITSNELRWLNSCSVLLLGLTVFNNLLRASLEAHFKLQIVNYGFLFQSICINIAWLILTFLEAPILYYFFVPVATICIIATYHLLFLPPIYSQLSRPQISDFKKVFRTTLQFFKVGVLSSIHMPLMKYVVILFLGQGSYIGMFDLSLKLIILVNNLLSYISNPLFSIISKYKSTEMTYVRQLLNKITLLLLFISSVGYVTFLFLEEYIIKYFFKTYSTEIFTVLNTLLIGYLLLAISEGVQKFLLGIGRANTIFWIRLSSISINLGLLYLFYLSNTLNIITISLCLSFSLGIMSVLLLTHLFKKNKICY